MDWTSLGVDTQDLIFLFQAQSYKRIPPLSIKEYAFSFDLSFFTPGVDNKSSALNPSWAYTYEPWWVNKFSDSNLNADGIKPIRIIDIRHSH